LASYRKKSNQASQTNLLKAKVTVIPHTRQCIWSSIQEYTDHKDRKVGEVIAGAVHNILAYCCLTSLSAPLWVTYHNIYNTLHANITTSLHVSRIVERQILLHATFFLAAEHDPIASWSIDHCYKLTCYHRSKPGTKRSGAAWNGATSMYLGLFVGMHGSPSSLLLH